MTQTFMLVAKGVPFIFVVPPLDLTIESTQLTTKVNLIDFGEIEKIGEVKPKKISFSTFLPNIKSNFYKYDNPLPPMAGVLALETIKKAKTSCILTVPELGIFYKCKILSLSAKNQERTGDIDISLTLIEDRETESIVDKITGLFKR